MNTQFVAEHRLALFKDIDGGSVLASITAEPFSIASVEAGERLLVNEDVLPVVSFSSKSLPDSFGEDWAWNEILSVALLHTCATEWKKGVVEGALAGVFSRQPERIPGT